MSADSFAALGVPGKLVQALRNSGIDSPFPIQTATLPDSLAGRDVLGRGRTGSGKTVAFALPTVVRLAESKAVRKAGAPRALILVPTRELAAQVNETIATLAKAMNMTTLVVVGGVKINPQINALRNGVDILVATPGRLEDLMKQRFAKLDQVEVTVLDEADHMADLGFLPIVKRLLDATPKNGQRLLFSATIDASVDVLVKRYLSSPVTHSVDSAESPVPEMTHHVMNVTSDHKPTVVKELVSGEGRTLAFTRTKYGAKKLARQLTAAGIPAVDLHGNLSQNARVRNLAAFSDGSVRVLVATDIAARGIHVDGVSLVVHVDPPAEHKAYLHRSGRTARAGADGIVITVGTPDQRNDVRTLMKLAAISPTMHSVIPGDEVIRNLVGPAAPFVKPTPVQIESADAPRRPIAPRGGSRKAPARPKAQQGRRR
jgi:superfamily II DNA/RNA helicase